MDFRSRLHPFPVAPVAAATLIAFLASLAPSVARAQAPQPGAQSSAQDRASARVLAEDADKKMTSGDFAGAAESFTKAYAFVPAPTIKVARAHAYIKLGRLIEAQQDLLDAARSDPQPGEPVSWGEARHKALAEAETITPRLPLLLLGVTGAPVDRVTLTVDGQPVAIATLGSPRAVNPGAHSLRAEAEGYLPSEQSVTLAEGEHKSVTFALTAAQPAVAPPVAEPAGPPPSPPVAPPAPAPESPPSGYSPPPPPPSPGYAPSTQPMMSPPEQPNNTASTLGWVGFGVFGGTALITGLVAVTMAADVKSKCVGNVCPTSARGEADTSSTLGNVSTVTFALTGGCLLLGILAHHSAPRRTATQPSFDLLVGPGSLGAVGTF
jgi:hypothetical protein